jgi:hypothetical protein
MAPGDQPLHRHLRPRGQQECGFMAQRLAEEEYRGQHEDDQGVDGKERKVPVLAPAQGANREVNEVRLPLESGAVRHL